MVQYDSSFERLYPNKRLRTRLKRLKAQNIYSYTATSVSCIESIVKKIIKYWKISHRYKITPYAFRTQRYIYIYMYVCIRRRLSADVVNLSVCLARAKLETMTRGENKFIKKVIVAEIVDEIRESN